jgi:hypothetical protein
MKPIRVLLADDNDGVPFAHRDRSREPQAGTSIGYAVRRLEREAPTNPAAAVAYERLPRALVLSGPGPFSGFLPPDSAH